MARGSRSGQVETYSWHSFTRSLIHFCWFGFSPPGFWLNKPCLCCKLADKTLKQFVHRSFILVVGKMRQQTSATPAQRQSEKYLMISNALYYNNMRLIFSFARPCSELSSNTSKRLIFKTILGRIGCQPQGLALGASDACRSNPMPSLPSAIRIPRLLAGWDLDCTSQHSAQLSTGWGLTKLPHSKTTHSSGTFYFCLWSFCFMLFADSFWNFDPSRGPWVSLRSAASLSLLRGCLENWKEKRSAMPWDEDTQLHRCLCWNGRAIIYIYIIYSIS